MLVYGNTGASLVAQALKNCSCNAGDPGLIPGLGRFPWRREWQLTPIFLPGEFHGQRSLVSYSPWFHKEVDMAEQLTHTHPDTHTHTRRNTIDFSWSWIQQPCKIHLWIIIIDPQIHPFGFPMWLMNDMRGWQRRGHRFGNQWNVPKVSLGKLWKQFFLPHVWMY